MLKDRWRRLCARVPIGKDGQWEQIVSAYGTEGRTYHNLAHVEDCLEQFDENLALVDDPVAVELAIWFHDVVYDTRASDNEARSAEVAAKFLGATELGERVAELIVATKHEGGDLSGDAALLCDIDLSILGRESARYQEYAEAIRREYEWVAKEDYVAGRRRVLDGFLRREWVFATDLFRARYERRARENMEDEIARLGEG